MRAVGGSDTVERVIVAIQAPSAHEGVRAMPSNSSPLHLAFATLSVIVPSFVCADSYDLAVVGARSEGMGGAAIAASDDSCALHNNPAALVRLHGGELMLVGRQLSDRERATSAGTRAVASSFDHRTIGFLGGSYRSHLGDRPLVLAAAYQRPLELVTSFRGHDIAGGVVSYSPGVAVSLKPWLSAGLAINVWGGSRDYGHDLGASHLWWRSTYSGTNATFGLLADLAATRVAVPLRLGLVVRTPFDLAIDYHERTTATGSADVTDAWRYRVEMPLMVGVGAAYDPIPTLTVALDVEHRRYGNRRIIARRGDERVVSALSSSGDDLTPVRIGLEYRLDAAGWQLPVRVGVRTVPTLRADRVDGVAKDQAVGTAYSGGIGAARGAFRLELTYSLSQYDTSSTSAGVKSVSTRTYRTLMVAGSFRFGA